MSYYEEPKRNQQPASGSPLLLIIALGALILAGASLIRQFWPVDVGDGSDPDAQPRAVTPTGDATAEEQKQIDIYRNARNSVVYITTLTERRDFFNRTLGTVPRGTGSGFIWDDEGHIVTNHHVIAPEGEDPRNVRVVVTLPNQSTLKAQVVGVYPDKDIAVLHLIPETQSEAEMIEKLRPILVGTSHDLKVGQNAFAIGNPFGLHYSLSKGIISALGREIETEKGRPPIRNVIQTDAAINPGNSGGPLLDRDGRLIGMNTAIYSPSGASAGIGFAVPVDEINRIVPRLIRKSAWPDLGIELADDDVSRRIRESGVMVQSVNEDGPAAGILTGIRPQVRRGRLYYYPGDVIIQLDDTPIKGVKDFYEFLEKQKVGQTVKVTFIRGRQQMEANIVLTPRRWVAGQ